MIRIQNIYYMLAYAFQALNEQGYKSIATENFENAAELRAAILERGITKQIKRGLGMEYIPRTEELASLKGKIEVTESIKSRTVLRRQLTCTYDEFSVDSPMNRIIKSTLLLLMRANISKTRKKGLRKLLVFFGEVETVDLHSVRWNAQYNRNNQMYRMLISVCFLIAKGLLQTQSDGTTKLMDFFDERRMHRLYEKFILEYYKKEFPQINARASQIPWALDDDIDEFLPVMQSDVTLSRGNKVLIIDAKYYSHALQIRHDTSTQHSANLYQIFAYVKNKDLEIGDAPHTVAGMLLYAKTNEDIHPDQVYSMSGNKICVRSLDLNQDFSKIAAQLNQIVHDFFGV